MASSLTTLQIKDTGGIVMWSLATAVPVMQSSSFDASVNLMTMLSLENSGKDLLFENKLVSTNGKQNVVFLTPVPADGVRTYPVES